MDKGDCVVDGRRGRARWCSLSTNGAGNDGLVHATHRATHGVGPCCRALVILSWEGACCDGVVVIHIAGMRAAVVPVVKVLDWCGGLVAWVMVAIVAGVVTAAVCATATVVTLPPLFAF